MKFKSPKYEDGEFRVEKWFALFPYEHEYETRWLETVYMVQRYVRYVDAWKDIRWSNEQEYKLYLRKSATFMRSLEEEYE